MYHPKMATSLRLSFDSGTNSDKDGCLRLGIVMLAIITGNRQVGKTRWLERFIQEAKDNHFDCIGLVSPGRWVEGADGSFEKTGIKAVLLPQNEELLYAVRPVFAKDGSSLYSQSDQAQLGWKIFDEAIERINAHFASLRDRETGHEDILIIDEIGPLELVHGKGFVSALDMLDHPTVEQAVIIMRPELLEVTKKRLAPVWGEPLVIDVSSEEDYRGIESLIKSFNSSSVKSY